MTCEHVNFAAFVDVARLTREEGDEQPFAFACSVKVDCADCGERFRFIGPMEVGDLGDRPTVSFDRCELRLPVAPLSSPEGFGLDGRLGFTMGLVVDPDRTN